MSLQEKISQAKAKLLVEQPYFGTLASRLELTPSDNIQAFLSDGVRFQYNDEYLSALTLDEMGFALSNGALHAALAHEDRQKNRMGWLWQLATDFAINAMLVENGLTKPPAINYQERFAGMYAEEIYATLKDEIQREEFNQDESNDTGFNEESKRHQNEMQNPDQKEATAKNRPKIEAESRLMQEAFNEYAKNVLDTFASEGELPKSIERFFTIAVQAKVDWRHQLHLALEREFQSDYTMMPPSKKLLSQNIYLPSLSSEIIKLVIAIDSSGSIDEKMLGIFIAEIESIMLMFSHYEIHLLVCDTKIHSYELFRSGEALHVDIIGGGGTDFRPVFEWIENNLVTCNLLLYFSDGVGIYPKMPLSFPVLWVGEKESNRPFGEFLTLQ